MGLLFKLSKWDIQTLIKIITLSKPKWYSIVLRCSRCPFVRFVKLRQNYVFYNPSPQLPSFLFSLLALKCKLQKKRYFIQHLTVGYIDHGLIMYYCLLDVPAVVKLQVCFNGGTMGIQKTDDWNWQAYTSQAALALWTYSTYKIMF